MKKFNIGIISNIVRRVQKSVMNRMAVSHNLEPMRFGARHAPLGGKEKRGTGHGRGK